MYLTTLKMQEEKPRGSHFLIAPPVPICFGYNPNDEKRETHVHNSFEFPNKVADLGVSQDGYDYDNALYWLRFSCLLLVNLCVFFFVLSLTLVMT